MTIGTLEALGVERILDSLADGAYITDSQRRILYWNRAAAEITGWPAEEVVNRTCFDEILVHVDKDGHRLCGEEHCPLHRAIVTGERSTVPIIVFAQSRSGKRVPMQVTTAPIRDARGEIVGGVETFRDLRNLLEDLERARAIQNLATGVALPEGDRLRCRVHSIPFDYVGGDFHRVEKIDPDRYAFLIADVMGHGVAAALYATQLRLLWEDSRMLLGAPAGFLATINARLHTLVRGAGHFATALCGILDLREGHLRAAGAGQPPALLFHADGSVDEIECKGVPLGLMETSVYEQREWTVGPGDTLLLYTDGAIEVFDAQGRELETEGFRQLLADLNYPREEFPLSRVEEELLRRSNHVHLPDDLTLVELRM